jgi:hypothetical protein
MYLFSVSGVSEPLHHVEFFCGRLAAAAAEDSPQEEFLLAVTADGGVQVFSLDEGKIRTYFTIFYWFFRKVLTQIKNGIIDKKIKFLHIFLLVNFVFDYKYTSLENL